MEERRRRLKVRARWRKGVRKLTFVNRFVGGYPGSGTPYENAVKKAYLREVQAHTKAYGDDHDAVSIELSELKEKLRCSQIEAKVLRECVSCLEAELVARAGAGDGWHVKVTLQDGSTRMAELHADHLSKPRARLSGAAGGPGACWHAARHPWRRPRAAGAGQDKWFA